MSEIRVEDTNFYSKKSIRFGEKLFDLRSPKVMGIVNCTPDSFYAGSRFSGLDSVLQEVESMVSAGVHLIDLGGYSSRPGADDISVKEEISRTIPQISAIRKRFPDLPISIDTFRGEVARAALENGANMINDISAFILDESLFRVLEDYRCPYVLMHSKGSPQTMQQESNYENLFNDICLFFSQKILTLRGIGINDIILDPGFGFAKTIEQNFELLSHLEAFHRFELPLLVGVSRKSMIYKTLDTDAAHALNGTTVLNTLALQKGAAMLRVHDVKEAVEAVRLIDRLADGERG